MLDSKACHEYLQDYRAYERGRRDEAAYHTYTPLIPTWFVIYVVYALVLIFTGLLVIGLIKWLIR